MNSFRSSLNRHVAKLSKIRIAYIIVSICSISGCGKDTESEKFCSISQKYIYEYENEDRKDVVISNKNGGDWKLYSIVEGVVEHGSISKFQPITQSGDFYLTNFLFIPNDIQEQVLKKDNLICEYKKDKISNNDWIIRCKNTQVNSVGVFAYSRNNGIRKMELSCDGCPPNTMKIVGSVGIAKIC